jgi:S-adenosylmethionine/arginine decarboxylase-like enzyme
MYLDAFDMKKIGYKEVSEMSALGRHILAEFYGCPPEKLMTPLRFSKKW